MPTPAAGPTAPAVRAPLAADAGRDVAAWALAAVLIVAWHWITRESLHLNLHFDEAQYAVWARTPAFGYFSKPPMVAWAIALVRPVCGASEFCVRLPAALATVAASGLVLLLARRLAGPAAGLPAALLFLLAPLTTLLASFMTTDSLLLLCWAAAVYAFVRAVQSDAPGWWAATGAAAGLGLLAKYSMGVFALSALLFIAGDPRRRALLRRPGPWLGVIVAAALFAPNLAWNTAHRFATLGHTAEIASLDRATFGLEAAGRLLTFVAEQFGVFGPPAMAALVFAWWACSRRLPSWDVGAAVPAGDGRLARRRADGVAPAVGPGGIAAWTPLDTRRLLLWTSLPFFMVIAAQATAARAHANWAAPTYVTGAVLAGAWFAGQRRRWLVAVLALDVAASLLAFHYRPLAQVAGISLGRRDPLAQLEGWDALGSAVRATMATQPPGTRLVTDERALVALLSVYAAPASDDMRVWNPRRIVDNHFRMLREIADSPQGPFLIVAERLELGPPLARDFEGLVPLPPVRAGRRTLQAWRAERFRGYGPP